MKPTSDYFRDLAKSFLKIFFAVVMPAALGGMAFTAPLPAIPACVSPISSPKLDLQIRCSGQDPQSRRWLLKIVNNDSVPVTIGNLSVGLWFYESEMLFGRFTGTNGDVYNAGGTRLGPFSPSNNSAVSLVSPACTSDPTHMANRKALFVLTGASGVTVIPAGGWLQGLEIQVSACGTASCTNWQNFNDDYTQFPPAQGSCGSGSAYYDYSNTALYYQNNLVLEQKTSGADPSTGMEPCQVNCTAIRTPTATSTRTYTPTSTATRTATSTNTSSPTQTATHTSTWTATPTFTRTPTPCPTDTPTSTASLTPTWTGTPSPTDTGTTTATETFTDTVTPTGTASETPTLTWTETATETSTPTLTGTSTPTPSTTALCCATFARQWFSLLNEPYSIASDGTNIFVGTKYSAFVVDYDSMGVSLNSWNESWMDFAAGIAVNPGLGYVYVTNTQGLLPDSDTDRVKAYTVAGAPVTSWGGTGAGNGQFNQPMGIAVNRSNGNVYVADYWNHRVQVFDPLGHYLFQWGVLGTGNGQFNHPTGVAINGSGDVYVIDSGNSRVEKFGPGGTFLLEWGTPGSGDGQFNNPQALTVSPTTGNVWVADSYNNRLEEFDSDGHFICAYGGRGTGNGLFLEPFGITTDAAGTLYVADTGNQLIQVFSPCGGTLTPIASPSLTVAPTETATVTPTETSSATSTPTDTATLTPTWTATETETASATPSETITVTSTVTETGTFTATETATATNTSTPDLTLVKSVDLETAQAGDTLTYTIRFCDQPQAGPASSVKITDEVPEFTTFLWATGPSDNPLVGALNAPAPGSTGTVEWDIPSLGTGVCSAVTLAVVVDPGINAAFTAQGHLFGETFPHPPFDANTPVPAPLTAGSQWNSTTANLYPAVQDPTDPGNLMASIRSAFTSGDPLTESVSFTGTTTLEFEMLDTDLNTQSMVWFGPSVFIGIDSTSLRFANDYVAHPVGAKMFCRLVYEPAKGIGQALVVQENSGVTLLNDHYCGLNPVTGSYGLRIQNTSVNQAAADTFLVDNFEVCRGVANGTRIEAPGAETRFDCVGTKIKCPEMTPTVTETSTLTDTSTATLTVTPTETSSETNTPTATGKPTQLETETFTVTATPTSVTTCCLQYAGQFGPHGSGDGQLSAPFGLAVDRIHDRVYITDGGNSRVEVFTTGGAYVGQWGTAGSGDGEFNWPRGIAVDPVNGYVYVADYMNGRIQKFTLSGTYVAQWGGGYFFGVALDGAGNVYAIDYSGSRVMEFSPAGSLLNQWGSNGTGDGQFQGLEAIAVDPANGYVYVGDSSRVQKFTLGGAYLTQWGGMIPGGIEVDPVGFVYVTDVYGHRFEKFDSNGNLLCQYGSDGSGDGQFGLDTVGIGADSTGTLYVVDSDNLNDRVEKIAPCVPLVTPTPTDTTNVVLTVTATSTQTLTSTTTETETPTWTETRTETLTATSTETHTPTPSTTIGCCATFARQWPNAFNGVYSIASDGADNLFVATGYPAFVINYSASGATLNSWSEAFMDMAGWIAVNPGLGYVYVSNIVDYFPDADTDKVKVYTFSGALVTSWGGTGTGNGQFNEPSGIGVNRSNGNVYVADYGNNRVQVFDSVGHYLFQWGGPGTGNGQFNHPTGVAIDASGNVYVIDSLNSRVEKFDSTGAFLLEWGSPGNGNGQFNNPQALTVSPTTGNIWVADSYNDRVEEFDASGHFICAYGTPDNPSGGNGHFFQPFGITADASGTLYVADTGNQLVQVLSPCGDAGTPTVLWTQTPTIPASSTETPTSTWTTTPSETNTIPSTPTHSATGTFTETATSTISDTPTASATVTPTVTMTDSPTETVTDTATETPTHSATGTFTETATPTMSDTPTATPTPTATNTVTLTPTDSMTPTATDTVMDTPTTTATPTCEAVQSATYNGPSNKILYLSASIAPTPAGWQNTGFDASTWSSALSVAGTYNPYNVLLQYSSNSVSGSSNGNDALLALTHFNVPAGVFSVVLNITVKGNMVLWLNGSPIPGVTNPFSADLTSLVTPGDNVLAIQLTGNGGNQIRYAYQLNIQSCQNYSSPPPLAVARALAQGIHPAVAVNLEPEATLTPTLTTTPTPAPSSLSVVAAPNLSRNGEPVKFQVALAKPAQLKVSLYSLAGEQVYTASMQGNGGINTMVWPLQSQSGSSVASGLFLYVLEINDGSGIVRKTGKVVVIH